MGFFLVSLSQPERPGLRSGGAAEPAALRAERHAGVAQPAPLAEERLVSLGFTPGFAFLQAFSKFGFGFSDSFQVFIGGFGLVCK